MIVETENNMIVQIFLLSSIISQIFLDLFYVFFTYFFDLYK